jgi:hypothetical protein
MSFSRHSVLLGGGIRLVHRSIVAGYTAIVETNHTISVARHFLFQLPELLSEWASIRRMLFINRRLGFPLSER